MAHVPAKLSPVLNLGRGNEQPDDEQPDNGQSFPRFLDLPPELRVMTCERYMESSGTVPSTHTQSALTRISRLVRQEALPIFYQHSTFAATINIWSRRNDRELTAHLDRSSDSMLDNVPRQHRSLVRKIKLLLVFNLAVKRRFEVTLDLTQWHDFARAIRFQRGMPMDDTQYDDIFLRDIQEAMETMYKAVGPLDGGSDACDRVLAMTESAVDDVFFHRNLWLDEAYSEMMRELVRKFS